MKTFNLRNVIFVLIPILIIGCSKSSSTTYMEGDLLTIRIDVDKEPENIHNIGLIKNMEIYSLKSDSILFYNIDKIVSHKNKFYMMDEESHSVIVYDTLGYLNKINDFGQGPKEYLQLSDIIVDTQAQTLNLVSRIDQKMLVYDLNSLGLKDIVKLPKAFTSLTQTQWGYTGYMGNYDRDNKSVKNVWTFSKDFNFINNFLEMDPSWNSIVKGGIHSFSQYKENVYYIQFLDNNIYAVNETEVSIPYLVVS